ncbi:MAG: amidase, partial [Burkholderiaceae bacterium]|nr:amidase [Burkholderiaceae bacterium]
MFQDLVSTRQRLAQGASTAPLEIEYSIAAACSPHGAHSIVTPLWETARSTAATPGIQRLPLAGLAVTVKDLFDMAGQPTPAGSILLAGASPARHDAPAVVRLRAAGAAILGRTHMVEFAFSGVGVNPHRTTPAAWDARHGALPSPPRIPGGSSSGAAVSVASGAAWIGLGSDTGGSIRIPAAFNGLVGFKSTARLVPTTGTIPLSTTLDTACALTRSVRDAIVAHEVLAARRVVRSPAPLALWRLAVPRTTFLDGLDEGVARAFTRTLDRLRRAGARIEEIALPHTSELGPMQAHGSFAAAESHAWHRKWLADPSAPYDPRVRSRIERGATMRAADYLDLRQAREDWRERMDAAISGYDALLSPT